MIKKIMELFASSRAIEYTSVFKKLGVTEDTLCDNMIDDIGDAIEVLVVTGQLCLDDSNILRRL
tara:strand:+ start:4459 stop:4650 length:192 start_codon:yes stop_codon:yes gene_type:complete